MQVTIVLQVAGIAGDNCVAGGWGYMQGDGKLHKDGW